MESKLEEKYQKKTQKQHILDAPDTYIGSVEKDEMINWILEDGKMKYKRFEWIPGLYKCFDESIVNCRDHYVRLLEKKKKASKVDKKKIVPVNLIDVKIDKKKGIISLLNNGNGIDVAKHPEHKLWIPEMIFGHLMTSTNYDKNEKKIVGGKNGFGFKLVLIYSKWGQVETVDHIRGLKYVQTFKNNLSKIGKPKITETKEKPYTKVSFKLDFERFGVNGFTDDIYQLLKKRTYDIGAVTHRNVDVLFNGEKVPFRTFEEYIDLYIGPKSETKRIFCKQDERWEYAVCLSPLEEFTQISFVNGIYTPKGGKHIDYILNQITRKIITYIEKKKKIRVKNTTIKEQLMLFVNCVVENPSFDSQTKETMNTPVSKFGSKCIISDDFIEKIIKLGVMETAISLTEIKESKLAKKTDGKKTLNIKGIPKLIDANWAGGCKSSKCSLILCEGDSAKAGIVSGLSKSDRNIYGVFPLKGKLMNVLDITQSKLNNNAEITNIKKILGLETKQKYKTKEDLLKKLRYGKVIFMTDQDLDGSHIKGLCINLFNSQWNDLMKFDNFMGFMNTPIIKASKGKIVKNFYYENEYDEWKKTISINGWKIKYYKGLGTSTAKEFKEYFQEKKMIYFKYNGDECKNSLDMVFNKKRANDRKVWLGNYKREDILDSTHINISYSDFVNKEMIHFSKYDCERSIPNLMDGLKISTRKILFSAFKRNLIKEIKVAQLAGYVSEHSCYHHGEKSLTEAIVNQAQEYVGSNNIAVLMPNGQFGTRLKGGADHASERYIFTQLNPITKFIYNTDDLNVLKYLDDDGTSIEPEFYVPIIPMILVNGTKGIGTGFSTDICSHKPLQIIKYLQSNLENKNNKESKNNHENKLKIEPYFEGFKGTIKKITEDKYLIKGCYKKIGTSKVMITELPIGMWTEKFKEHLETLLPNKKKNGIIRNYNDNSTDTKINFTITLLSGCLNKLLVKNIEHGCNEFEKVFKLYTTKRTTNMHLFDSNNKLKKYKTVYEIIEDYIPIRLEYYQKRKEYQIAELEKQLIVLSNKARFIKEQCDDNLDLRRKKKNIVIELLKSMKFDIINNDKTYKYLRTMSIDSVEEENYNKLMKDVEEKKKLLNKIQKTTIQQQWIKELNILEKEYLKYKTKRKQRNDGVSMKK